MKRQATTNIESIRDDLIENLLGKVFIDQHSFLCIPRFCQVVGWSKNTEKAAAKIRYVYAKEIASVRLEPPDRSVPSHISARVMIKYDKVASDLKKPIHTWDKKKSGIFRAILRIYDDGGYSFNRPSVFNPTTLATLEMGGRYHMHKKLNLKEHVFVIYED